MFKADKFIDDEYHLFSCEADGSGLVDLCGPLVSGGYVYSFHISPDGNYVAFTADRDTNNLSEMYVVPIAGGSVVKVSGGNIAGVQFAWSSDSTQIVHGGTVNPSSNYELFVSNRDGSGTVRVSGTMTAGGNLGIDFAWAPDDSRIAYVADQDTDGVNELYTSLPDGTGNVKVCGALTSGREVRTETLEWSPDSSRLSYVADQDADDVFELYTVAPDGTQNVKVSGTLTGGGDVLYPTSAFGFLDRYWAPDGSRIAYVADQDTDDVFELYSSLPGGGGNIKLSGSLVAGGDVSPDYSWSPDSTRIAFRADKDTDEMFELYAVVPTGGATYKLSGTLVAGGTVQASFGQRSFAWAPDSSRVAYSATQRQLGRQEGFTSLKNGTANVLVTGDNPPFVSVDSNPRWSPDSSRILFGGYRSAPWSLYSGLADGSGIASISGAMAVGGGWDPNVRYQWSPDSSCAFYGARQDSADHIELYCTLADGQGNIKISGTLPTGGHVGYELEVR